MMLVSSMTSIGFYALFSFLVIAVIGPINLLNDPSLAEVSVGEATKLMGTDIFNSAVGGKVLGILLGILIFILSLQSMHNIIGNTSRVSYLLSKERIFPDTLNHVNDKNMPTNSTIFTGVITGIFLLIFPNIENLLIFTTLMYCQVIFIMNLTCLIKIDQFGGGWGFYFSLLDENY